MGSMALAFYSISLLLVITNLRLSPFLVTCSSISSLSSLSNNNNSSISSILCHPEESSALLGFINSMTLEYSDPYIDTRLWKKGTDCCEWDGIRCDPISHHVVRLYLFNSGLVGTLDSNSTLFQLRQLRSLYLTYNNFCGSPISPMFGSSFPHLEELCLSASNFSGDIPLEISQLSKLQYLELSPRDNFPDIQMDLVSMKMSTFYNIISNMTQLTGLYLGGVTINSTIPLSFTNLSSLEVVDFQGCNLRGELPTNVLNMPSLSEIYLRANYDLNADFPLSNWSTSLKRVVLSSVNFSSKLPPSSPIQSQPTEFDLSGCSFHGQIPDWVWNISFTNNNSGSLVIDLSDNKFTGNIILSDNYSNLFLGCLDLSHNYLTGSFTNLPWINLGILDLSYNMFDGPLPDPPIGIIRFSASNNYFTGPLPSSLCNLTSLQILDLSNNNLKDQLPECFNDMSGNLIVLNLRSNNIYGTLSQTIFSNCSSLELLDLSVNMLEGLLPLSLTRCTNLKVLNLRSNKLRDEFPHWLGYPLLIQVLDLSWNFFFGSLSAFSKIANPFPQPQVLDLSHNNFSGEIPAWFIENLKAMMNATQSVSRSLEYLQSHPKVADDPYFYSITLTFNSVDRNYEKIITTLATFDLSNNKFEGVIPNNIGKLVSLYGLNLSYNQIVGPIPSSLGNLTLLNFLDLSSNKLTGQIPQELTRLTSLGVFKISNNQLVGPIPHGNNFGTFSTDSYNGNLGLCGFPLPDCGGQGMPRPQPSNNDNKDENEEMMSKWKIVMIGCGFGTFVSFVWGCYMLSIGKPLWLLKLVLILVDKVEKMFDKEEKMFGRRRRRPRRGRN